MRAASITRSLLLLIGATTIPLTLLSAGILYGDYRADQANANRQLVRQAQTVARLVDREIERAQTIARTIAASTALARGDLTSFRQELIRVTESYSAGLPSGAQADMLGLTDAGGHRIADSGPPNDGAAGRVLGYITKALVSGQPQVSDLYRGLVTGQPRISTAVPIMSTPGQPAGVIAVSLSHSRFLEVVEGTKLPPGSVASVHDRKGVIIARSVRDAETVGKSPPQPVLEAILGSASGLAPLGSRTLEGVPATSAFAHAPSSGFIVKIDVPETALLTPLRDTLLRAAGVGLLVLAIGLGLTVLLVRHLVVALRRVVPAAQAAALAQTRPPPLGVREADDLAAELTRVLIDQRAWSSALAASEANLRTLADALPQLVWAADFDGNCDYFNARCYAFSGAGELDSARWKNLVHPDDRGAFEASWQQALSIDQPFELECRLRRHDGEFRWMLVRAIPVHGGDQGGPVIRWFGSSTDITDLVDGREIAARGRAELETLIEQRTRDLSAMQTRLAHAARMEALGQLAGGIAHDFNNVLQAVLGGSALIERKANEPALVAKHARTVFDSAERGAAITRRLLAFSRRSALHAEVIDTIDLMRDIQGILSHTLGAAIRTEIVARDDLGPLFADKGQLETVLVNLAANARDAMDGRGTIIFGAERDVVADTKQGHPANLSPGTYICLSVSDTGTGMDAATLRRVVEPFFTTKKTGRGTGLGLAMAHGFAVQSGGGLHLESAPGEGTTVRLWLPVATGRSAKPAAPATITPGTASALLLLVDDEVMVREVVKETLEAEGYQVIAAASAEEALAALQTAPVELLISDLSMPGMDGVALIRLAQRRYPGLPAILMTGFTPDETDLAMSGAVSGAFSVLRKPMTAAQLCGRVADLLKTMSTTG